MKRAVEAFGSIQTPVGAYSRKGPTAGKGPTTGRVPLHPMGPILAVGMVSSWGQPDGGQTHTGAVPLSTSGTL